MSVIVFAGPSLSQEKALEILPNADIRPPAKQGDLYLATLDKPQIIVLIDGFFESVPAVWHKEILYAMSIGIHIYGCSSMGALRAAELNVFGMIGSGQIYERYASGEYEDDDEVALTHGPKELGYMSVSSALVDLRYNLQCAAKDNIISTLQVQNIEQTLKSLWYPERNKEALLQVAEAIITTEQFNALSYFMDNKSESLKERDAISALKTVAKLDLNTLEAKTIDYVLEENDAWHTLLNDIVKQRPTTVDISLPCINAETDYSETNNFPAKLRARSIEHAKQLGIEAKPWIQPAFNRVARLWDCISDEGDVQFEKMGQKIHALSLTTQQFDQWIEREALLLAYANKINISSEHLVDEALIKKGATV